MSDPHFGEENEEQNDRSETRTPVSRNPSVTDSLDIVFDLLRNAHRRYTLYYLFAMKDDVAELDAVVNAVCNYEGAGTDSDDQSPSENIQVKLHHSHLPKLAEAGIIDYDRRQGTIRFTPTPPLEEWLEHAQRKEMD